MTLGPDFTRTLQRAVEGDEAARAEVLEATYLKVRQIVHRKLEQDFRRNHRWIMPLFSTHDVVQDVLKGVLRDLEDTSFENEEAFVGYLGTVVRNRLLDAIRFHEAARRDARRQVGEPEDGMASVAPPDAGPAPPFAAEMLEQVRIVHEVMAELPERQRLLIQMRTVEQKGYPEICEELGYASPESARQSFVSAQARLLVKLRARGIKP